MVLMTVMVTIALHLWQSRPCSHPRLKPPGWVRLRDTAQTTIEYARVHDVAIATDASMANMAHRIVAACAIVRYTGTLGHRRVVVEEYCFPQILFGNNDTRFSNWTFNTRTRRASRRKKMTWRAMSRCNEGSFSRALHKLFAREYTWQRPDDETSWPSWSSSFAIMISSSSPGRGSYGGITRETQDKTSTQRFYCVR